MPLKKLRDVCELIVDCEHKTAPTQETGFASIRTPNIGRGRLILDGANRVSEETYVEWTRRAAPRGGDLILAREAPVGNVAIVPDNLKVCLGQRTVLIRPDHNQVLPDYLVYLLLGDEVQAKFLSYASGATVPHLNLGDIRKLELPKLPPLPTQRKIAAILSAYDDLIENNMRRIALLERMAQLLYREWFVRFRFPGHEDARMVASELGEIPEGWEVKRLEQLVVFQNIGTEPGNHLSDRHYLPIDCIPRHSLAISEVRRWEEAKSSLQLFEAGDILFGAMRPYFHKVVVAPFKGVTRKTCFVFRSVSATYHAYAALTLFQDSTVAYANAHSRGTTIPYAVWPQSMDGMSVLVPPVGLGREFQETVGPMISRIGLVFFINTTLRRMRDLLLPRLISGEIEVEQLAICTGV